MERKRARPPRHRPAPPGPIPDPPRDAETVVGRVKGAPVPDLLCEACAAKYGVEVVGYKRILSD
ncbi:MAG: hypothetical protein JW839_02860 [Candidatus Lokiarchaeota archaeon]|nr:hypothetical protein [Candidatus Lokiarchaeota archaeon]